MSERPRSRRPGPRWVRGVVACAVVLVVAGAVLVWATRPSGPPEIPAPHATAQQEATCRALVSALPHTLAGEKSVEVTGATAYGAAWGDPAIVLTCGVGKLDLTDLPGCTEVDGVGWLVPDDETSGDRDATFTADGYRPRVRLHVPKDYLPEQGATALAELAGPLKAHLELAEPCL